MRRLLCASSLLFVSLAAAREPGGSMKVTFRGTDYQHRWSKSGQHEFTPKGQEDLSAWTSMVTVDVHPEARTGEELAEVANRVLGTYQSSGKILRTDSRPRTAKSEAEHFVAVIFPRPEFIEVAFARFLLREKTGLVVVSSHRVYGKKAGDAMSAWLGENGPATEKALMDWDGIPSVASLRELPQSKSP